MSIVRSEAANALKEAGREYRKKPALRRPRWVIKLTFILFGCMFPALSVFAFLHYSKVRDWPAAEAVVTKSSLETDYIFLKDETRYKGSMEYVYSVGGRGFTGRSQLESRTESSAREHAPPQGTRLVVYYNPKNLTDTVLKKSLAVFWIGLGLSVLAFLGIPGWYREALKANGMAPGKKDAARP